MEYWALLMRWISSRYTFRHTSAGCGPAGKNMPKFRISELCIRDIHYRRYAHTTVNQAQGMEYWTFLMR